MWVETLSPHQSVQEASCPPLLSPQSSARQGHTHTTHTAVGTTALRQTTQTEKERPDQRPRHSLTHWRRLKATADRGQVTGGRKRYDNQLTRMEKEKERKLPKQKWKGKRQFKKGKENGNSEITGRKKIKGT